MTRLLLLSGLLLLGTSCIEVNPSTGEWSYCDDWKKVKPPPNAPGEECYICNNNINDESGIICRPKEAAIIVACGYREGVKTCHASVNGTRHDLGCAFMDNGALLCESSGVQ